MIHDPQHTLTHVSVEAPATLKLTFADGATFRLDLATTIQAHAALAALNDAEVFAKARLDSRGGYVIWIDDDLEMAADNLRHLAVEQAGGIGHERLIEWVYRHRLTQAQAAEAIGVSRRMLNYYLSGAKPIPKTVWLACLGWESQQAA
jgi:hypothetical protein